MVYWLGNGVKSLGCQYQVRRNHLGVILLVYGPSGSGLSTGERVAGDAGPVWVFFIERGWTLCEREDVITVGNQAYAAVAER